MRVHRVWVACAAVVVPLLAAGPLHAASAADNAAADALFKDARKLMAAKKYDEACPKFAESMHLSQRLGTLLNLATCHEKQGKTASAWAEFNHAVAMAKQAHSRAREKYAKRHAKHLEKRLARLTFAVPASLSGATLKLDGEEIGSSVWGTPLPVDPGTHQIEVEAPGKKPWSKQVQVKDEPGTTKLEVPMLEDAPAAPAAPSPKKAGPAPAKPVEQQSAGASSGMGHTLGWVSLGVGVIGVGVGSYFGLRTFSKKSDADSHCGHAIGQSSDTLCDAQGVDLRSQAHTSATISTIGFAVGAVGVGAGIVLLLTGHSTAHEGGHAMWIAPAVGPHGGALNVGGAL